MAGNKTSNKKRPASGTSNNQKPKATRKVKLTDIQLNELITATNKQVELQRQIDALEKQKKEEGNRFTGLLKILGEAKNFDHTKVHGVNLGEKCLELKE